MNKPFFVGEILLAVLIWMGTGFVLYGQAPVSPFDLLPRVPQSDSPDSTITIATSSNPFDLIKILPSSRQQQPVTGFRVDQTQKPMTVKEKTAIYQRFLFVTILAMMVILTLVVTIFRIFINKIWKAFYNDNLLSQLLREQSAGITMAYLILYLVFFINAGIFLFLVLKYYDVKIAESNVGALFLCMGGLGGFYLLKHAMLQTIMYVFPIEKEIERYNFTILVFNIILGFALVPMILFTAYAPQPFTGLIIYTTFGMIGATLIFRALRGLFIANRFFAWHKFHFFLYLCVVEIAPMIVTIKMTGAY